MKFYKDTDGIWYADEKNIIVGDLRFIISSPTEISIYWVGTRQPLYNGLVTGLQTSAGASYTDMADFLTACGSFFVNPLDSLEKEVEGLKSVYKTATLTVAGWVGQEQTVTVEGVTATNNPFISWPENRGEYLEWQATNISVTGQGVDELTFTATTTPTIDITVNVEVK